jgi:pyridoxine 5-phosphate synthase
VFIETDAKMIEGAAIAGAKRIELYTEAYAKNYSTNKNKAIEPYITAANLARKNNLGINAGHDLNLENLNFFYKNISELLEVSIGHALISDALYLGLENTVQLYLRELK